MAAQFKCIKPACGKPYESDEEEAYYCPSCREANKKLAAEIDARIKAGPRKSVASELQKYDSLPKIHGFVNARDFL